MSDGPDPAAPRDRDDLERRVAALMKDLGPADLELDAVPEGVWASIEAEAFPEPSAPPGPRPSVTSLPARRRRPLRWLAAAAAVVVVALGITFAGLRSGGSGQELAAAQLSNEGLSAAAGTTRGTARLERRDGRQFIELRLDDPPEVDGTYLEVWLIDREVQGMVSLGPYRGNGRYDVPSGVDPTQYPVVDVSIEPIDGKPAHSGESAVRGVLA
jgi:anti-sigma-K factor RskA